MGPAAAHGGLPDFTEFGYILMGADSGASAQSRASTKLPKRGAFIAKAGGVCTNASKNRQYKEGMYVYSAHVEA